MREVKSTKMIIIIFVVTMAMVLFWLISIQPRIYLKDYPAVYKERLDAIFGCDYTISQRSVVSRFEEHIDRSATYVYYYSWEITYTDQFGSEYTAELINRESDYYSFENQVFRWMYKQIGLHFNERLLQNVEGLRNETFSSVVFLSSYYSDIRGDEASRNNLRSFETRIVNSMSDPENLPHLYNLDYAEWFDQHPSYLAVFVRPSESVGFSMTEYDVAALVFAECGECFNAIIDLGYSLKGRADFETQYYIMGRKVNIESEEAYRLALFREYEKAGMFD